MFYTVGELRKLYTLGEVASVELKQKDDVWRIEVTLLSKAVVHVKTARGDEKTYTLLNSALSDAQRVTGYVVQSLLVQ